MRPWRGTITDDRIGPDADARVRAILLKVHRSWVSAMARLIVDRALDADTRRVAIRAVSAVLCELRPA